MPCSSTFNFRTTSASFGILSLKSEFGRVMLAERMTWAGITPVLTRRAWVMAESSVAGVLATAAAVQSMGENKRLAAMI
jgi:hypothetical protein